MTKKYRVALVKHGRYSSGGLSSVSRFLYQTLSRDIRFEVDLFSIDATYNDTGNLRLLSPSTWLKGVRSAEYTWQGISATHIGTRYSEFEFQRYRPQSNLTERLNQYDLLQVVSGAPAMAYITKDVKRPVCLFIATVSKLERHSKLRTMSFSRKIYAYTMQPIITWIEAQALRRVDHVFAETEYTKQACHHLTHSEITVDSIGVDTNVFCPLDENQRSEAYILSVGRFADPRKNVVMLFTAYALLKKEVPNTPPLVLVGKSTPSSAAWAVAESYGIAEHIVIKQGVSFNDLITMYQNAAMFVLSSNEEGLGIVLLEAMACATPVISTRCGGPDSVVSEDVGILTPVDNAESMAEQMLWMLQHPKERRQMGRAGRQMVMRRFSNEVVRRKYLDVYTKLLKA